MAFIEANHSHFYVETHGHVDADVIVFLHGLGSRVEDWQAQVDEFSKDYRVVTLDLRGHGRSEYLPAHYSVRHFAEDVIEITRKMQLASFHLVGLSLGAVVALQMALSAPDIIRSLCLVNGFVELPCKRIKDRLKFAQRIWVVRLLGMRKMAQLLASRLFPEDDQAVLRAQMVDRFSSNHKSSYITALRSLKNWSVKDQLQHIQMPTLVLASEFDYTPLEEKQAYVAAFPNARLETVPGTRHALPVEAPTRFNESLKKFLQTPE